MASAASTPHCPECGAPVKSGDKQCWMCFRLLGWKGGAVHVAAANQFAERPVELPRTYYRTNPWAIVGIVLAVLAMVPTVCIAMIFTLLTTCTSSFHDYQYPASLGAGFIVFVGFAVLIGILGTRVIRAVPEPTMHNR